MIARVGLLALAVSSAASAASQMKPFLEGLNAVPNAAARQDYIRENKLSPDALDPHEEFPALMDALRNGDPVLSYMAGQYLGYVAIRAARDPRMREALREALPALVAHFDDRVPAADLSIVPTGYHLPSTGWPRIVFGYLATADLPIPPETVPAVVRSLDGPNSAGAIEHLSRLKPLPDDVLRALLRTGARARVISYLGRAKVDHPDFVQAVFEALSSSDRDLVASGLDAAWELGATMKPALPLLRRIVQSYPANTQIHSTADMLVRRLAAGRPLPAEQKRTVKEPGVEAMRVGPYFEFVKKTAPAERRKLLANDMRQMPFLRPLVPQEDLNILVEALRSDDPALAASAAAHLTVMALQNRSAGTKVRELVASALPALAAHYDDPNPPDLNDATPNPIHIWARQVMGFVSLSGAVPPADLTAKFLADLDDRWNGEFAAMAVAQIKPMPANVFDALMAKMQSSGWDVRNRLISNLVENRVSHPKFVEALADYVDHSPESRRSAVEGLYYLGPAAKSAEAALRRLVSGQTTADEPTLSYARKALENLTAPRSDKP